jgi:mutator protein MutT
MPAEGPLAGPRVGVGGVVICEDRVLLVRRGKEPLRGRWVVPGGTVELGESLADAVVREIHEETGIQVAAREIVTVFDRIQRDEARVVHHHVIVDFVCEYVSGVVNASSDAEAAAWVSRGELAAYDLPEKALEVVLEGFRRANMLK